MLLLKSKIKYSKILKSWIAYKKNTIKEQSYMKYYLLIEKYIIPLLGDYTYQTLDNNKIKIFFENKNIVTLSLSTQRTLIFIIKGSIQYGADRGLLKPLQNIDLKIKKPKAKIVYFTREEQKKLESKLKATKDIRKVGILICLYTGIRLGEICGLKWKDIDFNAKTLSINRTVQRIKNNDMNIEAKTKKIISSPKSDSSKRIIPIPDFLLQILLEFQSNNDYYILTNDANQFKDTRVYEKYLENILKQCNLRKLNFHTLRHTFATRCIESGMDIKTLSEILGHSSYRITLEVYVHSTLDQKRVCLNNLVKYINSITEY